MSDNEGTNGAETDAVVDDQGQNQTEELRKQIDTQAKDLAGKDRKLSELQKQLSEYVEKEKKRDAEQQRIARQNMTAEQVQYELEKELNRMKAEHQRELAERDAEYEEVHFQSMVYNVASQIGDCPSFLVKALIAKKPKDEDSLREFISGLIEEVNSNRIYIGNRDKVASTPKSGDGRRQRPISPEEYDKMNEADRRAYISRASKEELEKLQEQALLK